jgi:hypothetical protein
MSMCLNFGPLLILYQIIRADPIASTIRRNATSTPIVGVGAWLIAAVATILYKKRRSSSSSSSSLSIPIEVEVDEEDIAIPEGTGLQTQNKLDDKTYWSELDDYMGQIQRLRSERDDKTTSGNV